MIVRPPHITPLSVVEDIIRIAQGELPLKDRLVLTDARIDQFVSDLEDYGRQYPASRKTNDSLKKQLRHRLKAAANRWIGMEEVSVFKEALTRLTARDDREHGAILH